MNVNQWYPVELDKLGVKKSGHFIPAMDVIFTLLHSFSGPDIIYELFIHY